MKVIEGEKIAHTCEVCDRIFNGHPLLKEWRGKVVCGDCIDKMATSTVRVFFQDGTTEVFKVDPCSDKMKEAAWYVCEFSKYRWNDVVRVTVDGIEIAGPEMRSVVTDDYLMTMADWKDAVECHMLMDDDGWGYYSDGTRVSDVIVHPSDWDTWEQVDESWSHVVWLNR